MGRKPRQTVDWFPHYCLHKMTMAIIEGKHGNKGYAFWFKLLEMLGTSQGHYINFTKPHNREFLQAKTYTTNEECCEILDLLAELDAIDKTLWENKIIWSDNFIDGISEVYYHRSTTVPIKPTLSEITNLEIVGNSRISLDKVENSLENLEIVGNSRISLETNTHSSLINNNIENNSRVEESKSLDKVENSLENLEIVGNKNNKKKEFSPSVLLTTEEYDKLIERFGEQKTKDKLESLSLYKQSKGKKYASDYATILNWDRRDEKDKNTPIMPKKRFEPGVPDDYDKQLAEHMKKIEENKKNVH